MNNGEGDKETDPTGVYGTLKNSVLTHDLTVFCCHDSYDFSTSFRRQQQQQQF